MNKPFLFFVSFLLAIDSTGYAMNIFEDFDHTPPNLTPEILRKKIDHAECCECCYLITAQCCHVTSGLIAQKIATHSPYTFPLSLCIMATGLIGSNLCLYLAKNEKNKPIVGKAALNNKVAWL